MAENSEIANDWDWFVQLAGPIVASDEIIVHRSGKSYRADADQLSDGILGPQAFEAERSTDQSVDEGGLAVVAYDDVISTTGADDFSISSGRLQVFKSGVYMVTAGVVLEAVTSSITQSTLVITRNAQAVAAVISPDTISASTVRPFSTQAIIRLDAGDIVDARVDVVVSGVGLGSALVKTGALVAGLASDAINRLTVVRIG